MIGDCYSKSGDQDSAIVTWNKLSGLYPDDPWVPIAKREIKRIQAQKEGK